MPGLLKLLLFGKLVYVCLYPPLRLLITVTSNTMQVTYSARKSLIGGKNTTFEKSNSLYRHL